jgi:CO/xanthine dehydrogenase Mo-binding subunit
MDPLEFRLINAYRDGDMKAHRREAKNCALIECAQVAAEKASWPLRDEFRRMSSRAGGGAARTGSGADRERKTAAAPARTGGNVPQRVSYERPVEGTKATPAPPASTAPPPATAPQGSTHGTRRFSSVFGARRR